MKIGIFGDSFASFKSEENATPTWVDILSEKYDVTNFAVPGSNLYYSVITFLENNRRFDKIIFLVTVPGRLHLPDWVTVDINDKFVQGPVLAEWQFNNHIYLTRVESLARKAAVDYYIYLDDSKYNNFIQELMVNKVIDCRPDAVVIPVSESSFGNNKYLNKKTLVDIFHKENLAWNETMTTLLDKLDFRNCHMTAENNVIFANKVEQWINGDTMQIDLDDFVIPMNKEFYIRTK
jgi:hypothetical protein